MGVCNIFMKLFVNYCVNSLTYFILTELTIVEVLVCYLRTGLDLINFPDLHTEIFFVRSSKFRFDVSFCF